MSDEKQPSFPTSFTKKCVETVKSNKKTAVVTGSSLGLSAAAVIWMVGHFPSQREMDVLRSEVAVLRVSVEATAKASDLKEIREAQDKWAKVVDLASVRESISKQWTAISELKAAQVDIVASIKATDTRVDFLKLIITLLNTGKPSSTN